MKRERIEVNQNSLASLFILMYELEPVPEAFRLQEIDFTIPFREYIAFCTYALGEGDFLATSTRELKEYLRDYYKDGSCTALQSLRSAFYKDLAYANLKEAWYSELVRKGPARYLPTFSDEDVIELGQESEVVGQEGLSLTYFSYRYNSEILETMFVRMAQGGYSGIPGCDFSQMSHTLITNLVLASSKDRTTKILGGNTNGI